jgi:hypothetical protein
MKTKYLSDKEVYKKVDKALFNIFSKVNPTKRNRLFKEVVSILKAGA